MAGKKHILKFSWKGKRKDAIMKKKRRKGKDQRKQGKVLLHKKKKEKIHKVKSTLSAKALRKQRWVGRKKTFSIYPYIMTISYYKTNVFFTAADIHGQTKVCLSTGQSGFKNKERTTYMAIVRVTAVFLKKIYTLGIRCHIVKFKNLSKRYARSAVRYCLKKFKRRYLFHYVGLLVQHQTAFNGCRKKKKRRK